MYHSRCGALYSRLCCSAARTQEAVPSGRSVSGSPFPVSQYRGTVEVFTSYDGSAVVVWTIDFESEVGVANEVAALVEQAISAGSRAGPTPMRPL